MPRIKMSNPIQIVSVSPSDDTTVPVSDVVDGAVAAGLTDDATTKTKKVTVKAARRAKTCERCLERREREREYARIARARARALKGGSSDAAVSGAVVETSDAKVGDVNS
jgi:hypothetical protein